MDLNWSNRVIKYVLFLFNFLFVISGIILIAVGASIKTYYTQYNIFLNDSYFSLPNLLIATGCLIFFISFFGCCGAYRESWFMIFIFACLLSLIFILEFSAGIAGYVLRDKTSEYLTSSLLNSMKDYQRNPPASDKINSVTKMWDLIQYEFECCGAQNASDWNRGSTTTPPATDLPASCCKPNNGVTGETVCDLNNQTTATFYKTGCVSGFGRYLREHATTLGGVGMAIAFIQLFGVIFACHLARQLKHGFYST